MQRTNDPILDSIIAPTTTAMVDFITHTVGWKYAARYNALSYEVVKLWTDAGRQRGEASTMRVQSGSVKELRQSVAVDPKLNVLIVHGWNDLSCPFMASVLIVDQMPIMGNPKRVQVKEYAGGHMFYSREASRGGAAARRHADVRDALTDWGVGRIFVRRRSRVSNVFCGIGRK